MSIAFLTASLAWSVAVDYNAGHPLVFIPIGCWYHSAIRLDALRYLVVDAPFCCGYAAILDQAFITRRCFSAIFDPIWIFDSFGVFFSNQTIFWFGLQIISAFVHVGIMADNLPVTTVCGKHVATALTEGTEEFPVILERTIRLQCSGAIFNLSQTSQTFVRWREWIKFDMDLVDRWNILALDSRFHDVWWTAIFSRLDYVIIHLKLRNRLEQSVSIIATRGLVSHQKIVRIRLGLTILGLTLLTQPFNKTTNMAAILLLESCRRRCRCHRWRQRRPSRYCHCCRRSSRCC